MADKEKGLFTVAEDEQYLQEEVFYVDESPEQEDLPLPEEKPAEESKDWLETGKPEHFIIFLKTQEGRIPTPLAAGGNQLSGRRAELRWRHGSWQSLLHRWGRSNRSSPWNRWDQSAVQLHPGAAA